MEGKGVGTVIKGKLLENEQLQKQARAARN
jgi:hypothetical protein